MSHRDYIVVKLKAAVLTARADGRVLRHHGMFANHHLVRKTTALTLIDAGLVKLPAHMDTWRLRAEVAAMAA